MSGIFEQGSKFVRSERRNPLVATAAVSLTCVKPIENSRCLQGAVSSASPWPLSLPGFVFLLDRPLPERPSPFHDPLKPTEHLASPELGSE